MSVSSEGNWLAAQSGFIDPASLELRVNPLKLAPGTYHGSITIDAPQAENSRVVVPATLDVVDGAPKILSVLNGANFAPRIAPVSIFGSDLSSLYGDGRLWRDSDFVNGALPTSLEGTSVKINGKAMPMAFVSASQLNLLAPDDDTRGPVTVEINAPKGRVQTTVTLSDIAPGLYSYGYVIGGRPLVLALHADSTLVGNPPTGTPAKPGEVILMFGTGFGPGNPPRPMAASFDPAPLAQTFSLTIGGKPAKMLWGGIIGPGLDQFNIEVPDAGDGDQLILVFGANPASAVASAVIPVAK
jgi:uncharacterized protein (TIGR03437 family)